MEKYELLNFIFENMGSYVILKDADDNIIFNNKNLDMKKIKKYENNELESFFSKYVFINKKLHIFRSEKIAFDNQVYFLDTYVDIDYVKDRMLDLKDKVYTDYKTGLLSYEGFVSSFVDSNLVNKDTTIIMADINKFKNINDTYGHEFGDVVLKDLGSILKKFSSRDLLIARYGGDEFIAATTLDKNMIVEIITKMENEIETLPYTDKKLKIKMSIGATLYDNKLSLSNNIDRADQALYQSKKSRVRTKNNIIFYK